MSADRQRARHLLAALAVVAGTILFEYAARHGVAPALPVLAAPVVNDMVAAGAAYLVLGLLCALLFREAAAERTGVLAVLRERKAWVAALAALAVLPLSLIDRALWGSVKLPAYSAAQNTAVLWASAAWLAPVVLLAVNGLLIPIVEERIWRGVVQPRMVGALGTAAGIGVTALLFSVKHAIVDASLGRLLFVAALGVVLGVVARAASWRVSALTHVLMNLAATAIALLAPLLKPGCMEPQPELPGELRRGLDATVALLQEPEGKVLEGIFAPQFLASFPETGKFVQGVRAGAGVCSWRCTVSVDGPQKVNGLLACEKRSLTMTLGVEDKAPHKVNLFVLRPADP